MISEGMDHYQNELEVTNILKKVNLQHQVFKKLIKDNKFGTLTKYNKSRVIKNYSDSETDSENSHDSVGVSH